MRIVICGFGRAGKAIIQYIMNRPEHELVGVLCRDSSKNAGADIGVSLFSAPIGIEFIPFGQAEKVLKTGAVDVVVDFSDRCMALPLIELCKRINAKLVICTTNHKLEEISEFRFIVEENKMGVVYAPNLTLGINLVIEFVSKLSKLLPDFDFEIIERHRRDKPLITNTARLISEAIDRGDTPISSIRVGGYVGVHEVTAANENERITIVHESFNRNAFTNGALLAAEFIRSRTGFYLMQDVIGEFKKNVLY